VVADYSSTTTALTGPVWPSRDVTRAADLRRQHRGARATEGAPTP